MLDRKFIIQNPSLIAENCARRGVQVDVDEIIRLNEQRLEKLKLAEDLNRQANETSKQIPKASDNDERQSLIAKGRELREAKEAAQSEHDQLESQILDSETQLPNLTHPDVPEGGEDDAKQLSLGKTPKREFDFEPLDHGHLGEKHDLFDFEAGRESVVQAFIF